MIIRELTLIPSPEQFLGIDKNTNMSIHFDSKKTGNAFLDIIETSLELKTIKLNDAGIDLLGIIKEPASLKDKLALVEIAWDNISYMGSIAISSCNDEDIL